MILTLFLIEIYFFYIVTGESNKIVYNNNKEVNEKSYKKSDSLRSSIYYTSKFQLKNKHNNIINQPTKNKKFYSKTKQNFKYYSIATHPVSKTNTLKSLPNLKYSYTKSVPIQYYKNTNIRPTLGYKYNINNKYYRPYQYNYYPSSSYYTPYNYYSTSQNQYNYSPSQLPLFSPLQYEYSYPHKGHGFFGNELAQFWLICHDCPRG